MFQRTILYMLVTVVHALEAITELLILMQQLVTNSSEELSLIVAAAPAADIAVDEDSRMLK